ncbi:ERF family protein [Paraburkholderia phymatum]|uniref:ERF family protein n=1 Tax=Paraburkholderia phymatum TaxID=148447 RepID=A0ACC6U172_9BURK
MALQTQWEAKEAKRAFDAAFSAFKAEAVTIIKGRKVTDGPLKNKSYAELHDVVNAVTPALSKHGLSSSWKLTKDEKDWMEVTCYLRHVNGHEESVSMGGPPDAGGAKNAIQARASTKTYLERYTLKAITGLSEQADDDDGNGKGQKPSGDETFMKYESQLLDAATVDDVRRIRALAGAAFEAVGDVKGWNQFKTMADKKKATLEGGAQ